MDSRLYVASIETSLFFCVHHPFFSLLYKNPVCLRLFYTLVNSNCQIYEIRRYYSYTYTEVVIISLYTLLKNIVCEGLAFCKVVNLLLPGIPNGATSWV